MSDLNRHLGKIASVKLTKTAVIAAVALAVLAVAAVAVAKKDPWHGRYSGAPDAGGTISFRTRTLDNGKHVALAFSFKRIPVNCTDTAGPPTETSNGQVAAQVKFKGKRIHYTATASNPSFESTLTIKGKLTHRRSRAEGTIRVNGTLVPINDSAAPVRPCDSGALHWTAKRK